MQGAFKFLQNVSGFSANISYPNTSGGVWIHVTLHESFWYYVNWRTSTKHLYKAEVFRFSGNAAIEQMSEQTSWWACVRVCTIQSTTFMKRTVGTPPNGRPWRTLLREWERKHCSTVLFSSSDGWRNLKTSSSMWRGATGGAPVSNSSDGSISTGTYLTEETDRKT